MPLDSLPRIALAHLPTPLEPLERLSQALGGPDIWIKRDDCTGLATGGNKARKLEFLMAAAVESNATAVATHGATQSNHARQTAAAAARLGLGCHILLEDRTGFTDNAYADNGNVLLDRLHGAVVHRCAAQQDMDAALASLVTGLPNDSNAYIIPGGGSNALGACGYVNAAREMTAQFESRDLPVDAIIHATGSAGTQSGLVTGLRLIGSEVPVIGVSVRAPAAKQKSNVLKLARETADLLDQPDIVDDEHIQIDDGYVGPGYGIPAESTIKAIRVMAKLEGILLDPVYSGKGLAGLIGMIRQGIFRAGQQVVFLHTGGAAALFAYPGWFDDSLEKAA